MAGFIGNIEIGGIYVGSLPISYVYVGQNLVWGTDEGPTGPISCFSGECWDDSLPWVDTEAWLN